MLGRLFKQQSSQSLQTPPTQQPSTNHSLHIPQLQIANSYEDSYTREILYGTLAVHQGTSNSGSSSGGATTKKFRLLVSQDGGNLRSKQVLFDSANPSSHSPLTPSTQPHSHQVTSHSIFSASPDLNPPPPSILAKSTLPKLLPSANELNDYMFGRGLPSSECHTTTKIHYLPHFHGVSGSCHAVLVTKLFLISDKNGDLSTPLGDQTWCPRPALPIKECSYPLNTGSHRPLSLSSLVEPLTPGKSPINSRFAVAVVIPYVGEYSLEDVVLHNWEAISHFLIVLQKLVIKKLLTMLRFSTVNCVCPYINNRRILFPTEALQNDPDLPNQLHALIKLIHSNCSTPRLMSSNSLIRYSLHHPRTRFKSILINWALEVINWLEFKDGRSAFPRPYFHHNHSYNHNHNYNYNYNHNNMHENESHGSQNTFLANLMALVLTHRRLLTQKPFSAGVLSKEKEVTRVVVMTGNSMVAKKLIFIINGLIPNDDFTNKLDDADYETSLDDIDLREPDSRGTQTPVVAEDYFGGNHNTATETPENAKNPENPPSKTVAQPIPIRRGAKSRADSSSEESLSVSISSNKGWEVPGKCAASVSFSGKPSLESSYKSVPAAVQQVPIHVKPSMSTSSSMMYLSSSLNSSFSSSASNYSFSKLGGSFFDKWRNSLVLNPEENQAASVAASGPPELSKKPSWLSLESPSPIDPDDSKWGSPTQKHKSKISRTQSMLDLNNLPETKGQSVATNGEIALFGLRRTRLAVVVPVASDEVRGLDNINQKRIQEKCNHIMMNKPVLGEKKGMILEVESGRSNSGCGKRSVYKQKPLLKNVAFVEEFRPDAAIQSCPSSLKLEPQVMNAMKNDLLFFQNHCGYTKVTSKTIFISLRAREIKMIEMKVGEGSGRRARTPNTPPATSSGSPITSYFSGVAENTSPDPRPQGAVSYKTSIRKVFTPHRSTVDREQVKRVERLLERLVETVDIINDEAQQATASAKMRYNEMLFDVVGELMSSSSLAKALEMR